MLFVEIVMATNHKPVSYRLGRLIYFIKKNKVGWNRDFVSPR